MVLCFEQKADVVASFSAVLAELLAAAAVRSEADVVVPAAAVHPECQDVAANRTAAPSGDVLSAFSSVLDELRATVAARSSSVVVISGTVETLAAEGNSWLAVEDAFADIVVPSGEILAARSA